MGELLLLAILDASLTPAQREVFLDSKYLGRPIHDIAATMGCSVSNVTHHLREARRKLSQSPLVTDLRAAA